LGNVRFDGDNYGMKRSVRESTVQGINEEHNRLCFQCPKGALPPVLKLQGL
jgi:hypothetical protein